MFSQQRPERMDAKATDKSSICKLYLGLVVRMRRHIFLSLDCAYEHRVSIILSDVAGVGRSLAPQKALGVHHTCRVHG